jgi:hypothetical protein
MRFESGHLLPPGQFSTLALTDHANFTNAVAQR